MCVSPVNAYECSSASKSQTWMPRKESGGGGLETWIPSQQDLDRAGQFMTKQLPHSWNAKCQGSRASTVLIMSKV